ncbi:MAG: type II toxin-antitoxin system RelE/ParE family toxin [Prevotella sp.]|jgi:plasmid stabilization system protein ParE|nr:type II toxin-antitoxin system RelE/ParE family toxin [Prevotella sp.]
MVIDFQPEAANKLKEIHAYYKEKSELAADKILSDIYDALLPLKTFPQMAAIESLLSDAPVTFRSLIVRSMFKVIYFIDEDRDVINIATIWDCRQDDRKMRAEVLG